MPINYHEWDIKSTIFEALPVAGGMMRVGIPSYRLPRDVLQREIDEIVHHPNVELKLNTPIRNINSLFDAGYSAVFLAMGAHEAAETWVFQVRMP